jgi:hypothetical protein
MRAGPAVLFPPTNCNLEGRVLIRNFAIGRRLLQSLHRLARKNKIVKCLNVDEWERRIKWKNIAGIRRKGSSHIARNPNIANNARTRERDGNESP